MTDAEILEALSKAATENQLMLWWNMVYGLIMAANGVGKSQSVCAELAAHVTGQYPNWWKGARFDRGGFEVWVGSIDNDMQKRGPQRALMGRDLEDSLGTGLLPADCIINIQLRQAGVKSVCDTVTIRHVSGENVVIKFLTFEQGWRKWQSGDPKIIVWDEEPDDSNVDQKDILSEVLTRLVRNNGIFLCGYTPLLGDTQLTEHFMHSTDPAVFYIGATWDDAPHMDADQRKMIEAQYPDHQRQARTLGIPMLGEGRIFSTPESSFLITPTEIPDHWARINGIDFGGVSDHPQALACLAWDRDADIVYLYDGWKDNARTSEHAQVINSRGKYIPVSWPHDGMKHDPKSGERFCDIYRRTHEVNMLSKSARYKTDTGGAQAQWPIIEELRIRLETNRFKVFRTVTAWVTEYRSYHTKNGKIVSKRDDLLKASFYGLMMLRFSVSKSRGFSPHRHVSPAPFTTAVH